MNHSTSQNIIAVIGATGHQGGGVVRALQARGKFRARALTRNAAKHAGIADEVVAADLTRPETLAAAFAGAYGVFAVTNSWEPGTDEIAQATAAIRAAKLAGVQHFIWSTLPDVERISGGRFDVPHFTNKAKVDALVAKAGFKYHTFVVPPFFYQNLTGPMRPQPQPDGSAQWTMPIDPDARVIHMGDIAELGNIVAGAFEHPELAGRGEYLPLVGGLQSINDLLNTLNRQGHRYGFNRVPAEVYATFYPGAGEMAEMFAYFEKHTYLGGDPSDAIALANKVAGRRPTAFADWARTHMPLETRTSTRDSAKVPAGV